MDIVTGIIKLLFGSKADKDRKAIEPYVNKIKEVYPSIAALSNDELRGRSQALMKQIADFIAPDEERIVTLKAQLENRRNRARRARERISKQIDALTETHRREDRTEARRDPARGVRHREGYGAAFRRERSGIDGDGHRFRPASWPPRRISSRSTAIKAVYSHPRGSAGGNNDHMGHGALRRASSSAAWCSTRARSPRWPRARERPLVATLPVFLNALARKGVHVVTVNDYLAKRDSEWMGPAVRIPRTVGSLHRRYAAQFRRPGGKAYMADITFGTNNEYGFDYLRDNMAYVAQRPRAAQASLRHRRRGRLGAHRRRPHAADHLRSRPQGRRPALRAVPPRHRESLQSPKESGDGTRGRGQAADGRRQDGRGRHQAVPRPQGSAQIQAAHQVPLASRASRR